MFKKGGRYFVSFWDRNGHARTRALQFAGEGTALDEEIYYFLDNGSTLTIPKKNVVSHKPQTGLA